jgi:hypothetical protein
MSSSFFTEKKSPKFGNKAVKEDNAEGAADIFDFAVATPGVAKSDFTVVTPEGSKLDFTAATPKRLKFDFAAAAPKGPKFDFTAATLEGPRADINVAVPQQPDFIFTEPVLEGRVEEDTVSDGTAAHRMFAPETHAGPPKPRLPKQQFILPLPKTTCRRSPSKVHHSFCTTKETPLLTPSSNSARGKELGAETPRQTTAGTATESPNLILSVNPVEVCKNPSPPNVLSEQLDHAELPLNPSTFQATLTEMQAICDAQKLVSAVADRLEDDLSDFGYSLSSQLIR